MATRNHTEITGITIPPGARAVLVFVDGVTGEMKTQTVASDASVFNIERDLLKHLNEQPFSTKWLTVLRAYCDQRLVARVQAKESSSISTPSPSFDWDMTRLEALQAPQ